MLTTRLTTRQTALTSWRSNSHDTQSSDGNRARLSVWQIVCYMKLQVHVKHNQKESVTNLLSGQNTLTFTTPSPAASTVLSLQSLTVEPVNLSYVSNIPRCQVMGQEAPLSMIQSFLLPSAESSDPTKQYMSDPITSPSLVTSLALCLSPGWRWRQLRWPWFPWLRGGCCGVASDWRLSRVFWL